MPLVAGGRWGGRGFRLAFSSGLETWTPHPLPVGARSLSESELTTCAPAAATKPAETASARPSVFNCIKLLCHALRVIVAQLAQTHYNKWRGCAFPPGGG